MLEPKRKRNIKLENIFSPRSPLEFLGFSLVGVIINLLSGAEPVGFIGVVVLFIFWWGLDVYRNKKVSKELVFSVKKEPPQGAKGLILLLSPYAPRITALEEQELKALIEDVLNKPSEDLSLADFHKINLFNSNLVPQIKAVEYHIQQGKLRDVWLITSEKEKNIKGSEDTAKILKQYLRFQYGQRLDVHEQGLVVKDWDYAAIWHLGEEIFRQSAYKDEVIVADITGGTKMMSVALAMACIPPKRRMQYMDSQRDWQGNPLSTGEIKPVVIDIDPILYPSLQDAEE